MVSLTLAGMPALQSLRDPSRVAARPRLLVPPARVPPPPTLARPGRAGGGPSAAPPPPPRPAEIRLRPRAPNRVRGGGFAFAELRNGIRDGDSIAKIEAAA